MTEATDRCVTAAKGPIQANAGSTSPETVEAHPNGGQKEKTKMIARIGKPAPDFELSAYVNGGFKNVKLSDYKGKWIVVCFYPGDFTFV